MPGPLDALKNLYRITSTGQPYGSAEGEMRGEMPLPPIGVGDAFRRLLPGIEVLTAAPVAQALPKASEVADLLRQLKSNLAKVPRAGSPTPTSIDPRISGLMPKTPVQRPAFPTNDYMNEMFAKYISKVR